MITEPLYLANTTEHRYSRNAKIVDDLFVNKPKNTQNRWTPTVKPLPKDLLDKFGGKYEPLTRKMPSPSDNKTLVGEDFGNSAIVNHDKTIQNNISPQEAINGTPSNQNILTESSKIAEIQCIKTDKSSQCSVNSEEEYITTIDFTTVGRRTRNPTAMWSFITSCEDALDVDPINDSDVEPDGIDSIFANNETELYDQRVNTEIELNNQNNDVSNTTTNKTKKNSFWTRFCNCFRRKIPQVDERNENGEVTSEIQSKKKRFRLFRRKQQ
ncbi:hypothetical protein BC833DRAFT_581910 [Globomyces pollinis-pini]|nr:hypothetical protein BC833DRAFT_581910 [Globomyces pollinis-pini]